LKFLRREECLKYFLTDASYRQLMKYKADFVVSCGFHSAGVNYIVSKNHLAKGICVLTSGLISREKFNVLVSPQHDKPGKAWKAVLITPKVAPNLINAAYLKEQAQGLLKHYSHLKGNARMKFGVLIGGNAKGVKFDETTIHELMEQLKDAATHYKADILLTTSRRTPPNIEQIILRHMKNFERCALCIIANQRNVPEAVGGILDLSDLVIASGESISMVSEALSSGKRTIVFSPHGRYGSKPRDKYEEFVLNLNDQGYLMVSSVDDIKPKITQLLSRKITLKVLEDEKLIQRGLEAVI
jgi:mitochondrial fission protein ELM1